MLLHYYSITVAVGLSSWEPTAFPPVHCKLESWFQPSWAFQASISATSFPSSNSQKIAQAPKSAFIAFYYLFICLFVLFSSFSPFPLLFPPPFFSLVLPFWHHLSFSFPPSSPSFFTSLVSSPVSLVSFLLLPPFPSFLYFFLFSLFHFSIPLLQPKK